MRRVFNTDGYCDPELHYMVDLSGRLNAIKDMVDDGKYFTINRARQYGKTTTLYALAEYLCEEYMVISLDFQGLSFADFETEERFVSAFSRQVLLAADEIPDESRSDLERYAKGEIRNATLSMMFLSLSGLCSASEKKVILLIDEVDSASNNQVFIDFLAQLRFYYLKRRKIPTFQSVILTGLYDVRNVKRKIRPDEEHKENSPWNIAADFAVDMSFSTADIMGMLNQYEFDYHTGMNITDMADRIFDYTSGYPYLVSRLCKFMDEKLPGTNDYPDRGAAWTKEGLLQAVKLLENESNALFQSMKGKLNDYPRLRDVLYELLFTGKPVPYSAMNDYIEIASMFGFIKNSGGTAVISNRIFETVLYNWFMSDEYAGNKIYDAGVLGKNQFIMSGHLNMRRILERFTENFDDLYGDQDETFLEDAGRRYFMLYLKPIINGEGNCYVEAQTRNRERTDLVIDYHGEQFVVELKIWRGNSYNERGENQLLDYLNYFHLNKGYMLSFNFNKKKEIGVREIALGDKVLVEAVV
ncbi:MAG: AAA-like domain-containing protein [Lachnospiraceae bacterium]|nr:AAA-like domain-containing protein [Lachnospiraceae bacterium]